ncbi:MAG: LssY C-terminal domain-containing protein [Candidatus Thiodiazotropha sp.]
MPSTARTRSMTCLARQPVTAMRISLALLIAGLLSACSMFTTYEPTGESGLPIPLERLQHLQQDQMTVHIAIPTDEEASRYFGVSMSGHDIQPIWMHIKNASQRDYWLMPFSIDPNYYSADEAAFMTGAQLSPDKQRRNRKLFRQNALPFFVPAGSSQEGFIYASYKRGGRFVDVRFSSSRHAVRMRFAVLLPTESFDYENSSLRELYNQVEELPDLSVDKLQTHLERMACCTSNADGDRTGDPLNLVIVGTGKELISALSGSGWDFTESITVDSIRRMIGAAIEEKAFLTAPVSSLYAFTRPQDIALQRGRSTINQRNHMRLWLAPFRCEGSPVWVGQVSRDIGVKLTTLSPTLTTHVIDPVVDEAREYTFHSLLHHDAVSKFAFARGVGVATEENPGYNLTADPFITDGMRLVVWLTREPVPAHMAEDLGWNESADPVREGKREEFMIPALIAP